MCYRGNKFIKERQMKQQKVILITGMPGAGKTTLVKELQKKYAQGRVINNSLQTNGTLLTEEWCRFFKDNNWLIGVSIDGPQRLHDAYRKNRRGQSWLHLPRSQ